MGEISERLFQSTKSATAGLWVYGRTKFTQGLSLTLNNMRKSHEGFLDDLNKHMKIVEVNNPLTSKGYVHHI